MATVDTEREAVVIRIVFDGPPEAGKTTSLRALGVSLGQEVETPGEERGRTAWFDWMEYTGGFFEGRAIRCQVVTVPGQVWFFERRRRLLEEADAVIFVADSQADHMEGSVQALREMRLLQADREVPPGLILQANKRDLPGALPLETMRERLAGGEPVALTESVASRGEGIRETFILAVRLALDRVRALVARGELGDGPPDVDGAEAMLARLRDAGPGAGDGAGSQPAREAGKSAGGGAAESVVVSNAVVSNDRPDGEADGAAEKSAERPPHPPDETVEGGLIWPPVGGRTILHEAVDREVRPRRLAGGAWADFGNRWWLIHSPGACRFGDEEGGRRALVEWARWHTALEPYLSSQRSVVLSPDGSGAWRLWQIVRRREPLAAGLAEAVEGRRPQEVVEALADAVRALAALRDRPEIRHLGPSVDTVTYEGDRPVLLSLMPPPPGSDPDGGSRRARRGGGDEDVDPSLVRWLGRELEAWDGGLDALVGAAGELPAQAGTAVVRLLRAAAA